MRKLLFLLAGLLVLACQPESTSTSTEEPVSAEDSTGYVEYFLPNFKGIIDSAGVIGSVLIYDPQINTYYSNDFDWARSGQLPASTFKIPNSLIALETGVVSSDSDMFYWDGRPRRISTWEADMNFRQAFERSCLPCYRQMARQIGLAGYDHYLPLLNFGQMEVDSSDVDLFWVQGQSIITQFEQIEFLQRFYNSELPVSKKSESLLKDMMIRERNPEYTLSGKTGMSIQNGENGWFVGYLEKEEKVYYFASNVSPRPEFDMDGFYQVRIDVVLRALEKLNILQTI